jgi:MFS family permease
VIYPVSQNLTLLLCACLHGLNHALQLSLPPLYLSIRDDLRIDGLSPVLLLGTLYFVTYAVTGLPFGFLGDRFSKKKLLVLGTMLNSVAFVGAAYCHSYVLLACAMILGGLGGGTYHPVANALLANLFKGTVGRAFGIVGMGASVGLFAGPFASGFLGQHFGWRLTCVVFGLFGMAVSVAFALLMPEEPQGDSSRKEDRVDAPGNLVKALLPVVAIFSVRDVCWWGVTYLTPAMSQMSIGFSEKAAGLLVGLISIMGVISQPLAGTVSDRFGRRKVLAVALAVSGICVVFFPHMGPFSIFPLALVSGFLLLGTVPVVDAGAAEIVPPSMRGRLFGSTLTVGLLIGALSPYLVGIIFDVTGTYTLPYLFMGMSAMVGAVLTLTVLSR